MQTGECVPNPIRVSPEDIVINIVFGAIPLTSEFIKNNGLGFKRHDEDYDELEIQIDSYSTWFVLSVTHYIDGAGDRYLEDIPVHHVHQLQHILRPCGLEAVADNLKIA